MSKMPKRYIAHHYIPHALETKMCKQRNVRGSVKSPTVALYDAAGMTYPWVDLVDRFQRITERGRCDQAFFFRHGATKYNMLNRISGQHNTQLSDIGRCQAVNLGSALPTNIDLIVCSGLTRAIETMELSVPDRTLRNATVAIDHRLNEVNLGVLQGRRRTYLSHFDEGDLDFAPYKGESYRDAARRVLSVIVDMFDLLAETGPSPRTAVIFCHAGVLRIVSTLIHRGVAADVFKKNPANTECVALPAGQLHLPAYWNKEPLERDS